MRRSPSWPEAWSPTSPRRDTARCSPKRALPDSSSWLGPDPIQRELLAAFPPEILRAVALVGSRSEITSRMAEYRAAGADEICVVPATTGDDEGRRTLQALAPDRAR